MISEEKTFEEKNRRHFIGKVAGGILGVAGGFAASFPAAQQTRSLRGADFPKQENLVNARTERQNHQLILDYLNFEKEANNRRPRMREKEFKGFLNAERELSEAESNSATECFKTLSGKNTKEEELRDLINIQIASYDQAINSLEDEKKQHLETQDFTVGDWGISIALSILAGLFGCFFGSKIDTNLDVADEKRAEQELIDSRK